MGQRVWQYAMGVWWCGTVAAAPFDDFESSRANYARADLSPRAACQSLASQTTAAFSVVSAGEVDGACRVSGIIPSEIRFEINLPSRWNGRLMMTGNGGLAGQPPESAGSRAASSRSLRFGFATAVTDTGHDARFEPGGRFAYNNVAKLVDYGYRGIHLTNVAAKALIRAYYRRGPKYSYFSGCSSGGRQALMEAQRFPDDFDGILAGAPANDFTGLKFSQAHRMRSMLEGPLDLEEVRTLGRHIYARCDGVDGLEDGLIDDPRKCDFDPRQHLPRCDGADETGCFDDEEIAALEAFYAPVSLAGEVVYPAFPVGSEGPGPIPGGGTMPGWMPWVINMSGEPILQRLGAEFFRYIVFVVDRPEYDWLDFDFGEAPDNLVFTRDVLDAVDPDLTAFERRGGKLLSYFGWADPDINPLSMIDYYDEAAAVTGEGIDDFFRLFLVPGMFHCAGGPGPSSFDAMTPLIDWVEKGIAPESIEARHVAGGEVRYTRPLCPYPRVARHDGSGSPTEAASFSCR